MPLHPRAFSADHPASSAGNLLRKHSLSLVTYDNSPLGSRSLCADSLLCLITRSVATRACTLEHTVMVPTGPLYHLRMPGPLIAVTMSPGRGRAGPRAFLNSSYIRALEAGGGTPLLVAPQLSLDTAKAILRASSGLMLTGGADIHPELYDQPPSGTDMEFVSAERDRQEIALAQRALERDLPVLAICRGMQALNIVLGGDLVQDIPSQRPRALEHRQLSEREENTHDVDIAEDCRLAEVLGATRVSTNSIHHQAIGLLGNGATVVATTEDGIIEGIEMTSQRWTLGVQWHPEDLIESQAHARNLFAAFVKQCSEV